MLTGSFTAALAHPLVGSGGPLLYHGVRRDRGSGYGGLRVIQAEGVIEGTVPVAGPRANGLGIAPLLQQLRAGEVSVDPLGRREGRIDRELVGAT